MGGSGIAKVFPVTIPFGFIPSDLDEDGLDKNPAGKVCPGQDPADGFRPRWGGGFRAKRVRDGKALNHAAVDIMAAEGAHTVAIQDGVIALSWKPGPGRLEPGAGASPKGGNYVVLDTYDGWRWYYAHLRDIPFVVPGQRVKAGDLLGFVGRTGNAVRRVRRKDGSSYLYGCPHLHLSLTALTSDNVRQARHKGLDVLGMKVDPVPVLKPLYDAGGWHALP
jgi:murein DD-endopeptidase MepM/ murein hydrolase activator NlpD